MPRVQITRDGGQHGMFIGLSSNPGDVHCKIQRAHPYIINIPINVAPRFFGVFQDVVHSVRAGGFKEDCRDGFVVDGGGLPIHKIIVFIDNRKSWVRGGKRHILVRVADGNAVGELDAERLEGLQQETGIGIHGANRHVGHTRVGGGETRLDGHVAQAHITDRVVHNAVSMPFPARNVNRIRIFLLKLLKVVDLFYLLFHKQIQGDCLMIY